MITIEQLKDVKTRTEALYRYLDIENKKIQVEEEQVRTQADALAADIDTRANDHPLHFVLMFAAEAADQILFVFISAGIVISHNRFSLSWVYCFLPLSGG